MAGMPTGTHSIVRIAVLEEQIKGLREQQRLHHAASQQRFDSLDAQLDALAAVVNRGRGAYAVALLVVGFIGALAVEMVMEVVR